MLVNNTVKHVQIISSLVLVMILIGCMYVPPMGSISEKTLATIKVGSTTKEEIVQQLGEPIILKEKKFFIYQKGRGFGNIIIFPVIYGGGGMFSLKTKAYRILLEFDENDVVKRCEIEEGKPDPRGGGDAS